MKTKIIYLLPFMIGFLMLIMSCKNNEIEEKKDEVITIKTIKVKEVSRSFPIRCSGKLEPKTESKLSFKTGGIIESVYVDEGQSVKKGTLLASLDLSEIQAQLRQAELALEKSKRDLKRVENLYNDSVATLENLQDATTAMELAESQLKIARFNLQFSKIKAPSDGKVMRKFASENELVSSGMKVFLFAPSKEEMVVRINLTDKEVLQVDIDDSARVYFDPYPDEAFKASVREIANTADTYTGTFEVELQLQNTSKKLISGFVAQVTIYPAESDGFREIPVGALVDGKGHVGYVFVVKDSKPQRRKISINRIDGDQLIVNSGLEPGEEVVTDGALYIDENSIIKIAD